MLITNKKIKVVVVDDEPLEINLLKLCIDWKLLNMEIVGEGQNALIGMDLVDELSPDILFTDINMPIIDGIKFSEMVLQKHPKTKIVILSGYDDFQYAQKSIKIGVVDFLLKPIDNDEVFKTAAKLKNIIDKERESFKEFNLLKNQLSDNLPVIKEKFLLELLSKNTQNDQIVNKANFLGLRFKYEYFQIASIEMTSLDLEDDLDTEVNFTRDSKAMDIVTNFFRRDELIYIFYDNLNRIILLNNNEKIDLFKKCEDLKIKLVNDTSCSVNIGIGGTKKQMLEIHASYKEALDALKMKITEGNNKVISYSNINTSEINFNNITINELNEKLCFYIKSGLHHKAMSLVNEYFKTIDLKRKNNLKDFQVMAMNILSINYKTLQSVERYDTDEIYNTQIAAFNELLLLNTLPDIINYLQKVIFESIDKINTKDANKIDDSIIKAKQFIDENINNNDLSLSLISKHLYLNPSYLSRMFKKELGISFVEYLTKIRMERAIELLKEGELKAFEIADCIGISDSNYFSTCFKKYTGLSISEYKKIIECSKNKKIEAAN